MRMDRADSQWVLGACLQVVAVLAAACSGADAPTGVAPTAAGPLPELIVSNPTALPPASAGLHLSPVVESVVYASLSPGSLPDAELAQFRNVTTGDGTTAIVLNGGFDPVPVPASAGDSIEVRVQLRDDRGERLFCVKVPPRRPPVVVRTDPSPGRRDVPLNSRMTLVFSEPLAPPPAGDSVLQLTAGDARLAGSLAFGDEQRLTLVFTPSAPLAAGTEYTLRLTTAIHDRDGEALAAPVAISFSTASSASAPPVDTTAVDTTTITPPAGGPTGVIAVANVATVLDRIGVQQDSSGPTYSRIVLDASAGRFDLKYFGAASVDTVVFSGRYEVTDSSIKFDFFDHVGAGPRLAEGIVRADTLHLRFNMIAGLDGFEDASYLLTHGALSGSVAPLPDARAGANAVVWGGSIYLIGGIDATGAAASEILAYDPSLDRWRSAGRLTVPVWRPGVAVAGDRIYVVGGSRVWSGQTTNGLSVADVQVFDPATGTISDGLPLPYRPMTHGRGEVATAVVDGRIHVMGGRQFQPFEAGPMRPHEINYHDVLDPASGAWSRAADMPRAGTFSSAMIGGRIFLSEGNGPVLTYDPMAGTWSSSARLGGVWTGVGAFEADGRLSLVGGIDAWGCNGALLQFLPDLASAEMIYGIMEPRCFGAVVGIAGTAMVFGGTRATDGASPTSPAITSAVRVVVKP